MGSGSGRGGEEKRRVGRVGVGVRVRVRADGRGAGGYLGRQSLSLTTRRCWCDIVTLYCGYLIPLYLVKLTNLRTVTIDFLKGRISKYLQPLAMPFQYKMMLYVLDVSSLIVGKNTVGIILKVLVVYS